MARRDTKRPNTTEPQPLPKRARSAVGGGAFMFDFRRRPNWKTVNAVLDFRAPRRSLAHHKPHAKAVKPDALLNALMGIALLILSGHDSHAATFNIANGDVTALKSAITTANSNGQDDTIELAVKGSYTLTARDNRINGLPQIGPDGGKKLTIQGNGATIQRSNAGGTPKFRIFSINSGADVTISFLAIANGNITALGGSFGGGIYNDGESGNAMLTISNCTFTGNFADYGGALYNDGETVSATLSVIDSTFARNSANYGGAIFNDGAFGSAALNVSNSTFTRNSADTDGGGIQHDAYSGSATLRVSNSTFHENSAGRDGGGLYTDGESGSATVSINHCTFSRNEADSQGGGIYSFTGGGGSVALEIGNTILKASTSGENIFNNPGTITSLGYNLSDDAAAGDATTGPGGLLNQAGDQRNTDPLLDPAGLKNNGGLTLTIALQATSPAVDQGKRDTISPSSKDQRGEDRPFDDPNIANAGGGDGSDIGAYEADVRVTAEDRLGNDLRLMFTTILGKSYEVQSRANLVSGMWTSLPGTTTVGTGGVVQIMITSAFGQGQQFYRMRQLP